MRIEELTVKNVRLFDSEEQVLRIDNSKNVVVILGNNGSGKSTLLDTISVMLSSFISTFPGMSELQFSDYDIHLDGTRRAGYLFSKMRLLNDNGFPVEFIRTRRGSTNAPQSDLKAVRAYAESLKSAIEGGNESSILPIIAYYGTGRGNIQPPERRRNFQRTYSRWDCYAKTLDPATNFKRFFAWYDAMEDEERREKERRQSFEYRSPVLQAVRMAINTFAGFGDQGHCYKNPRIEIRPLRFALDECSSNGDVIRELRLEQFSDGYKIIIAMVADIASRMAEGNPSADNPLDTPGVVLIDEIDLHLHPKWQKIILRQLRQTFRNVQFIVTTHSPIVVLGALDITQIVSLDGHSINCSIQQDYSSYDVNQLLLSRLFGLDNVLTSSMDDAIKRREVLLMKPSLTTDEEKELQELEEEVSQMPLGKNKLESALYRTINAIASKMGIKI